MDNEGWTLSCSGGGIGGSASRGQEEGAGRAADGQVTGVEEKGGGEGAHPSL